MQTGGLLLYSCLPSFLSVTSCDWTRVRVRVTPELGATVWAWLLRPQDYQQAALQFQLSPLTVTTARIGLHDAPSLSPSQCAVSRRKTEDVRGQWPPGKHSLHTHVSGDFMTSFVQRIAASNVATLHQLQFVKQSPLFATLALMGGFPGACCRDGFLESALSRS